MGWGGVGWGGVGWGGVGSSQSEVTQLDRGTPTRHPVHRYVTTDVNMGGSHR